MRSIQAIVRIRTPHWANPFARRRVEERLVGDSPLTGTNWLIEYSPSANGHEISVEGATISSSDRLAITQAAFSALASALDEVTDASR
ncbi:hypothetical protein [Dolichospermum phage Dfl-JY45]